VPSLAETLDTHGLPAFRENLACLKQAQAEFDSAKDSQGRLKWSQDTIVKGEALLGHYQHMLSLFRDVLGGFAEDYATNICFQERDQLWTSAEKECLQLRQTFMSQERRLQNEQKILGCNRSSITDTGNAEIARLNAEIWDLAVKRRENEEIAKRCENAIRCLVEMYQDSVSQSGQAEVQININKKKIAEIQREITKKLTAIDTQARLITHNQTAMQALSRATNSLEDGADEVLQLMEVERTVLRKANFIESLLQSCTECWQQVCVPYYNLLSTFEAKKSNVVATTVEKLNEMRATVYDLFGEEADAMLGEITSCEGKLEQELSSLSKYVACLEDLNAYFANLYIILRRLSCQQLVPFIDSNGNCPASPKERKMINSARQSSDFSEFHVEFPGDIILSHPKIPVAG